MIINCLKIHRQVHFNPQAPVAQKSAEEVVFRHFQGEGVEFFFNRTSLTPHQIFDAYLLETTDLSPSRFHFSTEVGFYIRSVRPDLKKKLDSFTLEMSKNNLIRNFLRNGRLRVN